MKLLVDHNLPPRLATALHAIFEPDHEIRALREHFGRSDVKDEDWIVELGRQGGWAVLSGDIRIAKKKPSRDAFLRADLVGFFFTPAVQKKPVAWKCARLLTLWPSMVTWQSLAGNGVYELPASGAKFRQIGR